MLMHSPASAQQRAFVHAVLNKARITRLTPRRKAAHPQRRGHRNDPTVPALPPARAKPGPAAVLMARTAHLPGAIPRLRVRRQKSGVVYYYYDHGGRPRRETPLGSDYGLAIQAWCQIERTRLLPTPVTPTLRQVVEHYRVEVVAGLPHDEQHAHHLALDTLLAQAGDADRLLRMIAVPAPADGTRRSNAAGGVVPQLAALQQWCTWMGYLQVEPREDHPGRRHVVLSARVC